MSSTQNSSASAEYQLRDALAGVGKALGHPHRLRILELLAQRDYRVEQLAELCSLNMASTSQHLQQLRRSGLITAQRDGRQMIYRLTDERIVDLLGLVRDIAQSQLAEVERLLGQLFPDDAGGEAPTEVMSRERLLQGLDQGTISLLDVRPTEEYDAGHLPGARHLTLADLESHLNQLPHDQTIVAYCRGPYCTLSHQAVAYLRQQGFRVARLAEGFPEWKRAGLPVEAG